MSHRCRTAGCFCCNGSACGSHGYPEGQRPRPPTPLLPQQWDAMMSRANVARTWGMRHTEVIWDAAGRMMTPPSRQKGIRQSNGACGEQCVVPPPAGKAYRQGSPQGRTQWCGRHGSLKNREGKKGGERNTSYSAKHDSITSNIIIMCQNKQNTYILTINLLY